MKTTTMTRSRVLTQYQRTSRIRWERMRKYPRRRRNAARRQQESLRRTMPWFRSQPEQEKVDVTTLW